MWYWSVIGQKGGKDIKTFVYYPVRNHYQESSIKLMALGLQLCHKTIIDNGVSVKFCLNVSVFYLFLLGL